MNTTLIRAVMLTWVPVVALLFRLIGPWRASLVGLLGGVLFLPDGHVTFGPTGFEFPVNRWNVTGLGLILGVLIFDFGTLWRFRPRWLDLPMVLYTLSPLTGLVNGVPGSTADVVDSLIVRTLGWLVPYLMGRLYLGGWDGPTKVGVALVISGIVYVPLCLYEEIVGPARYLGFLIYGIPVKAHMVDRLGGWRPEVFLGDGISVACWMALTTVMATWLWLGGAWRSRWCPAWLPPLLLMGTTLSCRGIYAYLILAIGLTMVVSTWLTRSRAVLVVLALIPIFYMGLRASGLWDGRILVDLAGSMGRAGTVDYRIKAEDEIIGKILKQDAFFGFGNYLWHGVANPMADGSWLYALWIGGLVGLVIQTVALYVLPASLALAIPTRRPSRRQAMCSAWGLAALCILLLLDGMHNISYFSPLALIGGTLVGAFLSRNEVRPPDPPSRKPTESGQPRISPLFVGVVIGWLLIEVFGQMPRTTPLTAPSVTPQSNPSAPVSR